jgi:hypothetical protein
MAAMSTPDWLGSGLEIVSKRAARAIRSYGLDQLRYGRGLVVTWAVAAGLFAVAGVFVIGIFVVGLMALFSFVRLYVGLFESYAFIVGLLFLLVLLLSFVAMWLVRRPTPQTPSLTSHLRVATHAPLPSRANSDASISTVPVPPRSALLFVAAGIVLIVATIGRR